MSRDLLLAVDGGGTKTQAVVTDLAGNVLGRGRGPGSNPHTVGFERSGQAVALAVQQALASLVLSPPGAADAARARVAAACFGMSGVDGPEDEARITRWVSEQAFAPRFVVSNDSEPILAAGTPEGWGVALVSGTGSVCLGRSRDGRTARAGGWGTLLGDEGSGYQVALGALRQAARSFDGRASAPALLQAALRHWSVTDVPGLMQRIHAPETRPADIAGLAPAVLELAAGGDAPALAIVTRAAGQLALHVRAVSRRLGLERPPLALVGGMLRGGLRAALIETLGDDVERVTYVEDPALAGITVARRLLQQPAGARQAAPAR